MKVSAKYLSVVAAVITGVAVTALLPVVLAPFGVTPNLLPAIFQWQAFFGVGIGLLVLAATVAFNGSSVGSFSLAGGAAALLQTFIVLGPTGNLIPFCILMIAGMLVGAGQYLGARWLNTILPD